MRIVSYKHQGKRQYMEDEIAYENRQSYTVSGVFDGHGGGTCSKLLKDHFIPLFESNLKIYKRIKQALYITIVKIHSFIIKHRFTSSGSTCNVLVIDKKRKMFYLANLGDSRAIIMYKNGKFQQISEDHKPDHKKEKRMICEKGGFVSGGRVNGILAMSRSVGDCPIARYLCPIPDIYEGSLRNFQFIVQTSDGLLDVLSNYDLCLRIRTMLSRKVQPSRVLQTVVQESLCKNACQDNMAIILITG